MTNWTEKYRPKRFEEVRGQKKAIEMLKRFIQNFSQNALKSKKAIIFHGPPGTGKTTLAHVLAFESGREIFELNASDLRNRQKLEEVLRPAIEQKSLVAKNKIILVDEVDGLSASDRGGLPELLDLIGTTTFPIIITANNIWDKKFNSLRQKSEVVKLDEIDYKTITKMLIDILRKEGLFVDYKTINGISIRSRGDIRAAINDLQTVARVKGFKLSDLAERDKEKDIFNALRQIFKGKTGTNILKVFDSLNMRLDEIFLWIEENIPAEYSDKELARAYDLLSKADIFRGRIYRQQYWRFLVYENIFLSYGISSAKKTIKTGFTSYKKPTRILKIWLSNQKNQKKKTISAKYARYVHIGTKRALREFPIIRQILKNQKIREELKLSEEENSYLDNLQTQKNI